MKTTITKKLLGLALSVFSITALAQCPTITNLNTTTGANGTATVTPVITNSVLIGPASNLYWSTYPNATQTSSQGTFQFSANGTYSVCLNYIDSLNGCWSSLCTSVTINNMTAPTCNAAFTAYTDSNCVTHFVNSTTGTNTTYQWYDMSNGFNLLSTLANPTNTLPNGTYLIGLYSYSNGAFCDSVTQVVTVNCTGGSTNTPCQASFYSYTDSSCVTHFVNTSTGTNLTSSWTINNICYPPSSSNLSLSLGTGSYPVLLQTYSNGVLCDSSYQTVNVNCAGGSTTTPTGCQANAQFYVFADSTNTGNYFAYNMSSGSGNVSYMWNFGDGSTSTQQYPFHQYATPGNYVICLTVTATYSTVLGGTTTCSDTYCDSSSVQRMAAGFLMNQINVIPQSTTGIKQAHILTGLNAYPNPMADELTIEVATTNDTKLTYVLVDALGRLVLKGNLNNSKTTISTSDLENGFYSLSITNEKGSSLKTIKLVK
jgi:hypothetical protein